jgi:TRAP-type transport system small permease protein
VGNAVSQSDPSQKHLIHVEDEDVAIEHYPEDWLAFGLFWCLGFIVFLQFFTRYILNDSLAWTEEIARYGLMAVVFIGAIMVTRRGSHINVVLLANVLPAPAARVLLAFVDLVTLVFLALLAWFGVTIVERMQMQRMTVFDLSMAWVYGIIAIGCFFMLLRQIQRFWNNARDGWADAQRALTEGLVTTDEETKS